MRGRHLNLAAIAHAAGFVLVAVAIIAATLHFRDAPSGEQKRSAEPGAAQDPLSEELKRCQILAAQAKDDAVCEAAWAESRRRFFTYQPAPNAVAAPDAPPKSVGR
jgi:conjugative transfer region protein TrbK